MGVITHNCSVCGCEVFRGREITYEYPVGSGNLKTDVEGEFVNGGGQCKACGEHYCGDDGGFRRGLCAACDKLADQAEEEGEDEDEDESEGYMPF